MTLIELDVSGCLELTDMACTSIAKHCQRLETLGMMNLREVRGVELSRLFLDKRAENFKCITLSGTKNVSRNFNIVAHGMHTCMRAVCICTSHNICPHCNTPTYCKSILPYSCQSLWSRLLLRTVPIWRY